MFNEYTNPERVNRFEAILAAIVITLGALSIPLVCTVYLNHAGAVHKIVTNRVR